MSDADQLNRIEKGLKALDEKFDRLVVGKAGPDGLLGRVQRVEDRQGLVAWVCGLLIATTAGLSALIVPGWFKQH